MDEHLPFSDPHFRHYVSLNFGVAAGIAADAMIATLSRFSSFHNRRAAVKWAAAIGLTHWIFPLVGFIGGWYAAINVPLSAAVYLFGAGVMAWFVSTVVREAAGLTENGGDDNAGIWESRTHFWAAIWGVSLDALITGPGKTSATAAWTEVEVWLSFPIVGFLVFGFVMSATFFARLLQERYANPASSLHPTRHGATHRTARDRWKLGVFFTVGTWFEILIFSYFGLLAVAQTLRLVDVPIGGAMVLAAAALVGSALFIPLHGRVHEAQIRRADRAFDL